MNETTHKFWLKSKTILFNLALAAVGSWTLIEGSLGNLKASISPVHYGLLMAAVGVVGFVLRVLTASRLRGTRKETQ